MLGFIFIIVAFFICLAVSMFVCRYAAVCAPLEFGITATIGIFVIVLVIVFLRTYAPAP